MPKSFRELRVWKASIDLSLLIYQLTSTIPKHEVYGLSSQMRRAAVSIASNIAEGTGRGTLKDFRLFVITARGSNYELQTQVTLAARLGYGEPETLQKVEHLAIEVGKMLNGLALYLKAKQARS